jgi:hypothetical protein
VSRSTINRSRLEIGLRPDWMEAVSSGSANTGRLIATHPSSDVAPGTIQAQGPAGPKSFSLTS